MREKKYLLKYLNIDKAEKEELEKQIEQQNEVLIELKD